MKLRLSGCALVGLLAVLGCSSDSTTGAAPATYTLELASASVSLGQDSSLTLVVNVKRAGTDTTIKGVRPTYSSADYTIATVDGTGLVTGMRGGSTTITVSHADASVSVPVTVRARPATSVELTILTGPAGGLKSVNADTGSFYALPAHSPTSRLKAVVRVGNDTVFCNYCTVKTPARVMRLVRFVSLDPALATITNAANPTLQASTDTSGRVTPLDTNSNGVRFVLEVPGDNLADTVLVKLLLRPIDSLGTRPDSNFFPAVPPAVGLQKTIYPNADNTQANVKAASTTNFVVGLDFLSRVQLPPAPGSTTPGAVSFIPSRLFGQPNVFRKSVPNVTWESANTDYLDVNATGSVTGKCASIGGICLATNSAPLTCAANAGTMPAAFLGVGSYSIPSCSPAKTIPMPGAFCTSNSASDLSSTCTVWVRATALDQVTGKQLRSLYRVNIGR
jgi:hypothetical protein